MSNIDTSSWKEFKLDELFCAESGDFDIKKEHINGLGVDVVTAGETENGILGKSDITAKIFDGNTITIDMFGKCTYRLDCYKMVTHARVFSLKCLFDNFDEKSGLYMTTVLQKLVNGFSYSNMCSWNKIKNLSIKLPVTESEEINWKYMQDRVAELEKNRVAELEKNRVAELENYLIASGLNDYELTEEDKAVLAAKLVDGGVLSQNSISTDGCLKEGRKFRIGNLFKKMSAPYLGKGRKQDNVSKVRTSEFNLPLINCKYGNNGIMYYGREKDFRSYESVLTIIYNGPPTEGQVYYQEKIGVYTDAYIVKLKSKEMSKELGLYLTSTMNQSIHNHQKKKYSRGYKAIWTDRVENDDILLPIQTDSTGKPIIDQNKTYHPDGYVPDWDYMEKYIKATEKEIIKEVVLYKDEVIKKAKEIA